MNAPRPSPSANVLLREIEPQDLRTLYEFENAPAWCAMAMIKPRSKSEFDEIWNKIIADDAAGISKNVQKAILADGQLCGTIGCRMVGECHDVGFGLGQQFWGRGIASRALALLLDLVPTRPVYATAATTNAGSIRVLTKSGFEIVEQRASEETRRYLACDEYRLILR